MDRIALKTLSHGISISTESHLWSMGLGKLARPIKTRKLFENLYAKINCPHSDFRPSLFDEGREVRDYFLPANLLRLAEVVYQAKKTKEHVSLPLKAASDSDYRLYCLDTGF